MNHPTAPDSSKALSFSLIRFLNRQRQKQQAGSTVRKIQASLILQYLFVFLIASLIYAGFDHFRVLIEDDRYPHSRHLMVRAGDPEKKEYRSFTVDQVEALKNLPGIEAVQEHFYAVPGYFNLPWIPAVQPEAIISYDDEMFRIYQQLPDASRISGTIPVLLPEEMVKLVYRETANSFQRRSPDSLQSLIGQEFEMIPLLAEVPGYSYKKISRLRLTPEKRQDFFDKTYDWMIQETSRFQPGKLAFTRPLYMRMQVVGFVRERLWRSGNDFGNWGVVIPLTIARDIYSAAVVARGIEKKDAEGDVGPVVFVLTGIGLEQEVREAIRHIGLYPYGAAEMDRTQVSKLWKEVQEELGTPLWIGMGTLVLFLLFSMFQLTSARVREARREIGILRCLGATRKDICRLFLHLSYRDLAQVILLVWIIGNAVLLGLGIWSQQYVNNVPADWVGGDLGNMLAIVDHFPGWWLVPPIAVQLLPLTFLPLAAPAALFSAWKTADLDPSETLR